MSQSPRTLRSVLGGLAGLIGLSAVAGMLITATVTPAIAVSGVAATRSIELFNNLPSYLQIDRPMEPTTIYYTGENGNPVQLARFYDQNRIPVKYDQVAPVMYEALLSSEDKNFYEHGGIDLLGTTKALIDNLQKKSTRGGSSISQQYVKNVQMQRCEAQVRTSDPERDEKMDACWFEATASTGAEGIERKLQEMRYAIQLEKTYSKNEILIGYLNLANFGGLTYGIEAASQRYFNTTAAKLTISQAATLAGMVQAPNAYRIDDPTGSFYDDETDSFINSEEDGYAETLKRRNYVLNRMLVDGKITQEQHDEAYAEPITPDIVEPSSGCAAAKRNAYFCQYVKTIIESDPVFGETQEDRDEVLRRGGLDIYTSLDADVQRAANVSMAENVATNIPDLALGAAGVTIDPKTGLILAMVQNTVFSEDSAKAGQPGYSAQVFAADSDHGSSIGFSVGSTYKLFTLVDWLEKGHSLNEGLNGTNRKFNNMSCDGDPVPFDADLVKNAGGIRGYSGTPMRFTTESLNSGYFAMAEKLNLCDINRVADRMGVKLGNGDKVTDENVPFNVLGDKAIAPLDMAAAYATIANNGTYCSPKAIVKVVGPDDNELPIPETSCKKVIDEGVAATAAYALENVMTSGTGTAANPWDGTPLLGKTGTHNEEQTMMIEASTNAATAVWVGQYTGTKTLDYYETQGNWLPGIRYILARDMQGAANAKFGGNAFPGPEADLIRQVYVDLPDVTGRTIDEATRILTEAGFDVTVGKAVDSTHPKDTVAKQDPGAGRVASGTSVTISPSTGKAPPSKKGLPDVTGKSLNDAITKLNKEGYSNVVLGACTTGGPEEGSVSSMSPGQGSKVPSNTQITLTYSKEECP
ncbi:transglycosylase domain-containing protein [Microbacterium sp. YY-01]|uniref:transglycosylase domain-containing protein n=1 Tax=Microbacterium sp. YY-01 TaxID=3421634 RepID=UPI003D1756D6